MTKISKIKYGVSILLASLLVALSYELKKMNISVFGIPSFLLAVISFIAGVGLAQLITRIILENWKVRRWLMGPLWIEGYWLVQTEENNDTDSPVAHPAILFLEYNVGSDQLKAVVTRYNNKKISIGSSDLAFLREDANNIQYLNYFTISYDDTNGRYGMAVSEFNKNNNYSKYSNVLSGRITLEGDGLVRRQTGQRLDQEVVDNLVNKYGEEQWMRELLLSKDIDEIVSISKEPESKNT